MFIEPRSIIVAHLLTWVNSSVRLFPLPAAAVGPSAGLGVKDVSLVEMSGALTIEVTDLDQNINVLQTGKSMIICTCIS